MESQSAQSKWIADEKVLSFNVYVDSLPYGKAINAVVLARESPEHPCMMSSMQLSFFFSPSTLLFSLPLAIFTIARAGEWDGDTRLNNVINVIKCRLLNWKLQQNTQHTLNVASLESGRVEKWENPRALLPIVLIQHYSYSYCRFNRSKVLNTQWRIIFSHSTFFCPIWRRAKSVSQHNNGVQRHPSSHSHGWWSAVLSPMEQSSEHADIGVRHVTGEWNSRRLHVGGRRKIPESAQSCAFGMQPVFRCKFTDRACGSLRN